ncbi:MAG TPA: hypothetical protein VH497_17900 [Vicinamibacterales bacterium]|jgi:hypothetical protein
MRLRFVRAIAAGAALALSLGVALRAATTQVPYDGGGFSGVTLTTPDARPSCVDAATSDVVTTTGVGTRTLRGVILVQYVLDGGVRQVVPGGEYIIDHIGDINQQVQYPPVSQWPAMSNGTREIHIDVQLELWENGIKVATLGPGNDWDLFCVGGPPPPPPPAQGCTPGYWKNLAKHLKYWTAPYTPTTKVSAVFGVTPTFDTNLTLFGALGTGGGGEEALLRHAVAGLLDAANPNVHYKYSTTTIIQFVQQAYQTGFFEQYKNLLEAANEAGCPLNN